MRYTWPRSERKIKIISNHLTDSDFIRSLKEPIVLDSKFTREFGLNRWLAEETDANGVRPVDYDKFLADFDPLHEVLVETYDEDSGRQKYGKMTLKDFVHQLKDPDCRGLYLKDWHAQREFKLPSDFYEDKLPYFMKMDWINFEKWTLDLGNPVDGDYKFVYFGSSGSRTLLHYDVFRSFSWSLNVSGLKHWLFLPIEKTKEFFAKYPEETDFTKHPGIVDEFCLVEWIQSPGEIMIVPPGCYHQVLNLTECLSVNHNTINVFNVVGVCLELQERFLAVLKELEDQKELRDPADFAEVVEIVLNSDYRITKNRMLKLAQIVEDDRKKIGNYFLDYEPPQDIENPDFWTNGNPQTIQSIFEVDCGCRNSGRHLLSSDLCQNFIKKMKIIDLFFSQIVIKKMIQNNGWISHMGQDRLDNAAPVVFDVKPREQRQREADFDENVEDPIDAREIFDYIRDINDPEHPYTLEQLNVVQEELIKVYNDDPLNPWVDVRFTPTIPHCSLATLIGLSIRVKLMRSLPPNMKTVVRITEGTHNSEATINKQLADKERVAAAIENSSVMQTVNNCLRSRE